MDGILAARGWLDKEWRIVYTQLAMSDYLKRQLIAYLGNKRSLLPFLKQVFVEHAGRRRGVFLDPFAGSGAVSRLARTLGFEVHANDWETYAWYMNRAFLTLTPDAAEALYADKGGLTAVLERLNTLTQPKREYLARHFAPRDTAHPDLATERLFWTRENALFLDAVRQQIEVEWGPEPTDAKVLLVALLVYEASVHSNTSGVFKGFHQGFGGHGADALGRILRPMQLEYPALWPGPQPATATCLDAAAFLRGRSGELCYLDPPYNQHQYGSNYHLLNTVARGDEPAAEKKSGIRQDWQTTRSPFCSRVTALPAFSQLLEATDARTLVVSYNTEGVIPFEALYDQLDARGRVSFAVHDYVTYRGGRQSPSRLAHNLEFVLVVDTRELPSSGNRAESERFLAERRVLTVLKGRFHPERLRNVDWGPGGQTSWNYEITTPPDLSNWDTPALQALAERLAAALCVDFAEECHVLLQLLGQELSGSERSGLETRLLLVLRKLTFAKYRTQVELLLDELERFASVNGSERLTRGCLDLRHLLTLRSSKLS